MTKDTFKKTARLINEIGQNPDTDASDKAQAVFNLMEAESSPQERLLILESAMVVSYINGMTNGDMLAERLKDVSDAWREASRILDVVDERESGSENAQ